MQFIFQKRATTPLTAQSCGPYRSRTDEKDSNDVSQQSSYDSDLHDKIPGVSRKRKRVNQGNQNSQDRVILHPSDSDSDLSEASTCQRKDSEDPQNKYSRADSDARVEGGRSRYLIQGSPCTYPRRLWPTYRH